MNIRKIAVATLVPAAVVGVTASSWAAVQAATGQPDHPAAHVQAHQVRHVHPARSASQRTAQGAASKKAHKARAAAADRASRAARAHARRHHHAHAKAAPARAARPAAPSNSLSGMSAFEQCVAWRESGDNPTASSAGLFGILPSTWASLGYPGTAGQASISMQKAAFDKLYAMYGTSPWAPYDGC